MAIAFVGCASAASNTVNLPTFSAGDVAFCFAVDVSGAVPTRPTGWSNVPALAAISNMNVGWRVLQAGDTSSGTWTNADKIVVVVYSGVDVSSPLEQITSPASGNGGVIGVGFAGVGGARATSLSLGILIADTDTIYQDALNTGSMTRRSDALNTWAGVWDVSPPASGTLTISGIVWAANLLLRAAGNTFPFISDPDTGSGNVTGNSTSWTITYCTNIASGDLLLLFVAADGAGSATATNWRQACIIRNSGSDVTLTVLAKIAAGSETGTFTATISASEQGGWRMFRIPAASWYGTVDLSAIDFGSGVQDEDGGISGISLAGTGTSANPDPPSLDPGIWATEDTLWITAIACDTRTISGYPASFTNGAADGAGGAGSAGLGTARLESASASINPGTFTISSADDWSAVTIAIRPAGTGLQNVTAVGAIASAAAFGTPVVAGPQTISGVGAIGAPGLLALDAFGRTLTDSVGSADYGGAWSTAGGTSADFDVAGGFLTMSVPASSDRVVYLPGAASIDQEFLYAFKVDKLPAPAGQQFYEYAYLRLQGDFRHFEYRLKVQSTGGIQSAVFRDSVTGQSQLGSDSADLFTVAAGDLIWVRARATGQGTITIRGRCWKNGSAEPGTWDQDVTDTLSTDLQDGYLGIRGLSEGISNGPIVISIGSLIGYGGPGAAASFGTMNVAQVGAQNVTAVGAIATAEALGTATVTVGPRDITAVGAIASAAAFGGDVGTAFGALDSTPAQISNYSDANHLTIYGLQTGWDRHEKTTPGNWSTPDLTAYASDFNTAKTAGRRVSIEMGLGFPPSFYQNSTYKFIDQFGTACSGRALDWVWRASARDKVEAYIRKLNDYVPFNDSAITDVRIGIDEGSELLFPGDTQGGTTNSYWAFSTPAQGGAGLATGTVNGVERHAVGVPSGWAGWHPGDALPGGKSDVSEWYDWYLTSLVEAAAWAKALLVSLGFTGRVWAIMPGQGARPTQQASAYTSLLTTYSGVMAVGAAWHLVYPKLAAAGIHSWNSSAAENTGMTDITQAGDFALSSETETWSSHRRHAWLAARNNMLRAVENPGSGGAEPGYGLTMLQYLVRQATAAGAIVCMFAHETNLVNGTGGNNGGAVSWAGYTSAIETYGNLGTTGPTVTIAPPPQTVTTVGNIATGSSFRRRKRR